MLLPLVSVRLTSRPVVFGPGAYEYRSITREDPSVHTHSPGALSYLSSSRGPPPSVLIYAARAAFQAYIVSWPSPAVRITVSPGWGCAGVPTPWNLRVCS